MCEVFQSDVEGHHVTTLTCRMTYDWQARSRQFNAPPHLQVSLSWTGVDGTTVRTSADPTAFRESLETNMTIEDISSETIPSYTCAITFQFSAGHGRLYQYAVNPLSSTCVTPPTRVRCKLIFAEAILLAIILN